MTRTERISAFESEGFLNREVMEKLAQYPTPTVSNVIELFDVRPRDEGYLGAEIRAVHPELPPVVGLAVTATLRAAAEPHNDETETPFACYLERMAEVPAPRIVVLQDLDNPPRAGTLGECMTSAFLSRGCVGAVTSGYVRDVLQLKRRRFPVWARGICASHGYGRTLDVMVAVEIGRVRISPGTLLHADANGVVVIPKGIAPWVAAGCEDFARIEAELMSDFDEKGEGADAHLIYDRAAERIRLLRDRLVKMWKRKRLPNLEKAILDL